MSFGAMTVSSAIVNGSGGFDYEIASAGFPNIITNGAGDFFASETASALGGPSYWSAPGTSGIVTIEGQTGATPSFIWAGHSCVDNTGGSGACAGSSLAALVSSGATPNLLLAVSTSSGGNIISGTGIWALEHTVFSYPPFPNSFQASTFTFAAVPVPAAVWLFGSALGLLGLLRRRIGK
jgi:hypothetical protein